MSSIGWIKLHRSIVDNWVFTHGSMGGFGAWVDLLLSVNHKNRKVSISGTVYEVKRGQKITSILKLSERWKCGRKWVSSFLDHLEKDGMITQKRNNRFTLITISNYGDFQSKGEVGGTAEGTTEEQLRNNCGTTAEHKQECKEGKNVKKERKKQKRNIELKLDALQVFEYWKEVMNKPRAKFIGKRKRKVEMRLEEKYTVDDLKRAIDGCASCKHNQGANENQKAYNDLELICRNESKLEMFMGYVQPKSLRIELSHPSHKEYVPTEQKESNPEVAKVEIDKMRESLKNLRS